MPSNRVFLPQEALDQWLTEGRIDVDGDIMTMKAEGRSFTLKTAVHFIEEVASGEDTLRLCGRVKDMEQLAGLGGEHYADSVIIEDFAYQVVEGFVGEPQTADASVASGTDLAAAARAAIGDSPDSDELDLLARFFMN